MASTFVLTLDTTPPLLTWGQATNDGAGTLHVPYTLSDGEIISATIDGVPMVIDPSELRAPSTEGDRNVVAIAQDDVLNEATYNLTAPGTDAPIDAGTGGGSFSNLRTRQTPKTPPEDIIEEGRLLLALTFHKEEWVVGDDEEAVLLALLS